MAAYVIVQETVTDQATFDAYRKDVLPTVQAFGGKFLSRGGTLTVKEGEWPCQRTVLLEFASRKDAEAWYDSPAYQRILPLRLKSSTGHFVILEGTA